MQHLSCRLELLSPCTSGLSLSGHAAEAGYAGYATHLSIIPTCIVQIKSLIDRLPFVQPLSGIGEARLQPNKQPRGVEPDEMPQFQGLKRFSSNGGDQELPWSWWVQKSPARSPAALSVIHSTLSLLLKSINGIKDLLLNSVLNLCCKAAKPLCQISAPLQACN